MKIKSSSLTRQIEKKNHIDLLLKSINLTIITYSVSFLFICNLYSSKFDRYDSTSTIQLSQEPDTVFRHSEIDKKN